MLCRFLGTSSRTFAVQSSEAPGERWRDEGYVIRACRANWRWWVGNRVLGPWRSSDKAKVAISHLIESWDE